MSDHTIVQPVGGRMILSGLYDSLNEVLSCCGTYTYANNPKLMPLKVHTHTISLSLIELEDSVKLDLNQTAQNL